MEDKRLESFFAVERAHERFHHQPDDGTKFEFAVAIEELRFQHFGEMTGQPLGFLQIIQVTNDGQFHRATEWFDQVAHEAGTAATQFVDDAD